MRTVCSVLACVFAVGIAGVAQQKPQPTSTPQKTIEAPVASPPSEAPKPLVPLKVQILLTRFKGEKKVSSLPYLLGVTANDGMRTSLRMGVDVPVMTTTFKGPDSIPQPASWSYRSVGTNIDCRADSVLTEVYKLQITVADSSIHLEPSQAATAERRAVAADVPAFRSFNSTFTVLMRDGQTTQYTSAVDPVNGEVMKIDVTLTVIK